MAVQSNIEAYASLNKTSEIADLRALIGANIPNEELAGLSDDLIDFFAAFGEDIEELRDA